jgi:hypothetical protein
MVYLIREQELLQSSGSSSQGLIKLSYQIDQIALNLCTLEDYLNDSGMYIEILY